MYLPSILTANFIKVNHFINWNGPITLTVAQINEGIVFEIFVVQFHR